MQTAVGNRPRESPKDRDDYEEIKQTPTACNLSICYVAGHFFHTSEISHLTNVRELQATHDNSAPFMGIANARDQHRKFLEITLASSPSEYEKVNLLSANHFA